MITPAYAPTATERVLPRLALDFTTAITDPRVTTSRAANTATRFNASGLIEIVNANLPRFDFSPTAPVCRGQLIEEARTNLLLNSLIDGTNLATQSVALSAVAYTLSFYGSGSVTISGGHSAIVTGIGDFPNRKTYTFTPTSGSSTFTVVGDVKFAQLEAGAFATSFIPTAGSSVLRNADVVSMTGANFSSWYNASEGTFVCSVSGGNPSTGQWAISYDLGFGANLAYVRQTSATDISALVNGVASATRTISSGSSYTTALAYKLNSCAFAVNGGSVASFSATPGSPNDIYLGALGNTFYLNKHIKKLMFYPQRLTNAEVQAFSK